MCVLPHNHVTLRAFLLLILSVCFNGCVHPLTVPIETERLSDEHLPHHLLFVYLPGNGDPPAAFERHGLAALVRERGIPADIIAVNALLGYYDNGTILDRLKQDVIDPAKSAGYDRIWLIGNSLGAYGSLSYTARYPADIAGVVLLGAYAGERGIIREIEQAGGLKAWEPGKIEKKDWERQLWSWLKSYDARQPASAHIYLGFGRYDRFAYAQDLLATVLPPDRVAVIAGGHDWPTWKKLWGLLLSRISANLEQ